MGKSNGKNESDFKWQVIGGYRYIAGAGLTC